MSVIKSLARRWSTILLAAAPATALVTVLVVGLTYAPRQAEANPAFARMTHKSCAFCHVFGQEPRLNRTGQRFLNCGFTFC
jgi:hypothetical protein